MRSVRQNTLILMTALLVFVASFSNALHLAHVPIETYADATWTFVAIVLTFAGLLVSPVIILGTSLRMMRGLLNLVKKNKRKHAE